MNTVAHDEAQDPAHFEEAYGQLEALVTKLDQGGLRLAESLDLFEQGMRLVKQCNDMLGQAELRLTRAQDLLNGGESA